MRIIKDTKYYCSQCDSIFPESLKSCPKCGVPAIDSDAIKIKVLESEICRHECYKCKSTTEESSLSCPNPDCKVVFQHTKIQCPYCNKLQNVNNEKCECGFDFVKYVNPKDNNDSNGIESEPASKSDKSQSNKWLLFVNYFLLPFALISNVSFQIGYNYDTTLSLFILYSFVLALIYGLHKREIWGFYLYIVYFIYAPIQYSFDKANLRILVGDDFNYDRFVFIGMVFGLLIYTLPNIIYIVKRKGLFISDVDGSVSTKEVLNTTPQQKKSHKQTKTDMIETVEKLKESKSDVVLTEKESHIKVESDTIETIKKLAKLKNDGILTEKEFSEKKKELLGRI